CEDKRSNKFLRIIHFNEEINFIETYNSLKNANNRLDYILKKFQIDKNPSKKNELLIEKFLSETTFPFKKMIIVDKGRHLDEKSVILILDSNYTGFGYFNLNYQITNFEILDSLISKIKPKRHYNNIIINYLKKYKVEKIINIQNLR
ncbi:MAG: hypothetical protein CMD12_04940, partial [Flavobacteriales bacterium]|nr:hypothetical protein [Flavobacteriales bacterium]